MERRLGGQMKKSREPYTKAIEENESFKKVEVFPTNPIWIKTFKYWLNKTKCCCEAKFQADRIFKRVI